MRALANGRPTGPLWVCIPTYNEAENLERLVTVVAQVFDRARLDGHVLVIDDNSPDGTGAIAEALSERDARIHVLHRNAKEGLGRAYVAGYRRALAAGAALIAQMDCDFSHDPTVLPDLVAALDRADLVLGSRYVPGGGVRDWGLLRQAISRGGCWYARTLLGLPVRDLTGGFKCFRREVLERIALDGVNTAGYGFQVEVTYRAALLGFRIEEVPITFREREAGCSKMSTGIVVEAARLVWKLRAEGRRAAQAPASSAAPGTTM
jgi:dolichol-phosphate mannosyltransferase